MSATDPARLREGIEKAEQATPLPWRPLHGTLAREEGLEDYVLGPGSWAASPEGKLAVVTEASDFGVRTHSCPAVHLRGFGGSLYLWPDSEKPIRIPYAWLYSLTIRELPDA